MAASLQMLTIKRLFIVCNRETFAVLFLYVQDGVSGEPGLLRGWHGSGAVLSQGTRCLPPASPLSCSARPGHWGGAARGDLAGSTGGSGGQAVPVPLAGVQGAAESRPSIRWFVQGLTSCKFQETPREAHGGSRLGAAASPEPADVSAGTRSGEEKHKPVFKDICLFTIKTVSQRRPDRAVFMRRRRRLEGRLPIASYTEREQGLYFISGPGEGKKNKSREFTSL